MAFFKHKVDKFMENNSEEVDDRFRELLQEYNDLTISVDKAMADLKIVKDRRNVIEQSIQEYMKGNELEKVNLPKMTIQVYKAKTVKPLNRVYLQQKITDIVGDELAKKIIDYIYNNREYVYREKMKRVKIKDKN